MLLERPEVLVSELEQRTGWSIKPEGACKGELCVPLPGADARDGVLDAAVLSERLGMALVHEPRHGLWALGPEAAGGRALVTAELPDISLPGRDGDAFSLRALRGTKVLLLAWASW
jgi:hypothetical protein